MIVLDTHVWVWWVSGSVRLSAPARKAISEHVRSGTVHLSAISVWEVALLVRRGRLELTQPVEDWVARSMALPFVEFVPVDPRIALRSVALPAPLHDDPADRIVAATAITLGATLLTRDARLLAFARRGHCAALKA